jgi:hypothetical protein
LAADVRKNDRTRADLQVRARRPLRGRSPHSEAANLAAADVLLDRRALAARSGISTRSIARREAFRAGPRAAAPNNKAAAQRLAEELQLLAFRQCEGLEALPAADGGGMVAEILRLWLESYARRTPRSPAASACTSCRRRSPGFN